MREDLFIMFMSIMGLEWADEKELFVRDDGEQESRNML